MGCENDLATPNVIEGIELKRCPVLYTGDQETIWIQAYQEYINGHYPEDGGWLDQTIKYSLMMAYIGKEEQRIREAKHGRNKP